MGQIYLLTCMSTGKYYVGQTISPLVVRWRGHKLAAKKFRKGHLQYAIQKYGSKDFIVETLLDVEDFRLNEFERLWILALDANNPKVGMNMTFGGDGAGTLTAAQKAAIAKRMRGNKHGLGHHPSSEQLQAMRQRKLGTHISEEAKKLISLHRSGISSWSKGLKLTEAQCAPFRANYWEKRDRADSMKNMLRAQAGNRKGIHLPMPATRTCRECKVEKVLTKVNFSPNHPNSGGPDVLDYKCKPCRAKLKRERCARKESAMVPERLSGKPESIHPIPFNEKMGPSPMTKQPLPQPESTEGLMSSANKAIEDYTKRATSARHPMGHGIPKSSPLLQE